MANSAGSSAQHSDDRKHKSEAGVRNYIAVARGSDLVVIRVVGKGNMINAPALAEFADEQRKAGFSRFVFDMERCQGLDSTFMGVMVGLHASVASESGAFKKVSDSAPRPRSAPKDESSAQPAATGAAAEDMTPLSPEEAARELEERFHGKPDAAERPAPPDPAQAAAPSSTEPTGGLISAVNVQGHVQDLMAMLGVDKFVKLRGACDLGQLEMTILPEKQIPAADRRRLILKAHETLVEIDKRNEVQFGAFLKTLSAELAKEG